MEYVNASSVQQVLDTLAQADGGAVVLAGGTDLMVDFKAGKVQPQVWVDVTRVPELCGITVENGKLVIGAAVTLTTIARSPLVRQYFPSLAQGCGTVGSLQIRNSATLWATWSAPSPPVTAPCPWPLWTPPSPSCPPRGSGSCPWARCTPALPAAPSTTAGSW